MHNGPHGIAITPDGNTAWVANANSDGGQAWPITHLTTTPTLGTPVTGMGGLSAIAITPLIYATVVSTTQAVPPPGNPQISAVAASSITVVWTSTSPSAGYEVDASTAADFSGTVLSTMTTDGTVTTLAVDSMTSLSPNTTYFIRVGNFDLGTTSYASTTLSTSTLTSPIAGAQVYGAFVTSITVNWSALGAGSGAGHSEGYSLQASAAPDFTGTLYSTSTTDVTLSTLTLQGLAGSTTYYLRAGGVNWSNVANYAALGSTVTSGCTAWPNGYCDRVAIAIDHRKVPNTDQINFPFLFRGTYTYLATQANGGVVVSTNGYDIIFSTDPNGASLLPHEIETYSSTTGNVNMWTQVPTVSHSTDTILYLFYGNPAITTSQQNVTGVWDNNYRGVWHMGDHAANAMVANSTTWGDAGTAQQNTSALTTTGEVDGALKFNGGSDYVGVTQNGHFTLSGSPFTLSGWLDDDSSAGALSSTGHRIISWYDGSKNIQLALSADSTATMRQVAVKNSAGPGIPQGTSSGNMATGWHYGVATFDGSNYKVYVDGNLSTGSGGANLTQFTGNSTTLYIGQRGNGAYVSGALDEIRISSTARSADWIAAEYCNQSGSCVFYSTGPVNAAIANPVITAVSTFTVTVAWAAGMPSGSGYEVDASTAPDFSGVVFSSVTADTSATTLSAGLSVALSANTTYYLRAGAISQMTTSYVNTTPVSTSTLANLIVPQVYVVNYSSITVNWPPLPGSPSSSSAEGYELDASTNSNFVPLWTSSMTASVSVSTLTLSSLPYATTLYLRAGAINWDGVPITPARVPPRRCTYFARPSPPWRIPPGRLPAPGARRWCRISAPRS